MSIKRRFEYQYRRLSAIAGALDAPAWMMSLFFRVSMITLIVLVCAGYLFKISSFSTSGYQLHDLERQVTDLQSDIQRNNVEIATYSSITNIEKRLADAKMVSISEIQHIDTVSAVAVQR